MNTEVEEPGAMESFAHVPFQDSTVEAHARYRLLESTEGVLGLELIPAPSAELFVLDEQALEQLKQAIDELETRCLKAAGLVVFARGVGFIAGADLSKIQDVEDPRLAESLSREGQLLFARFAALPCPTAAAIDGVCLGGGFELALALDYRVASTDGGTKIGLPEVKLGILPGFGGTQRLPRLVGLPVALDLMLKGSLLDAERARRKGLIDRAVPKARIFEAAFALLRRGKQRKRRLPLATRLFTHFGPLRGIVRRKVLKTLEHGPARKLEAPRAILESACRGLARGRRMDEAFEARTLGRLATSKECKNLIRLFLASEEARKLGKQLDPGLSTAKRISVIGAGVMGAGIAGLVAERGMPCTLIDLEPSILSKALLSHRKRLDKKRRRRRLTRSEVQAASDRLGTSLGFGEPGTARLSSMDLVLEAVSEDLMLKRKIFEKLCDEVPLTTVLASNTSSLPLAAIADGLKGRHRFVGLHFFNPPGTMPLVEIIRNEETAEKTIAIAAELAARLGKFPVVVQDGPGFLVNRCLAPYLASAARLLEAGLAPGRIDAAASEFGMPMGPCRLLDEIGWDVAAEVCDVLGTAFPERMQVSSIFERMKDSGLLGKKLGQGIYLYEEGKQGTENPAFTKIAEASRPTGKGPEVTQADLIDLLLLPLVSESFLCLAEGVVASEEALDLAMVMGIGFPPGLGGPIAYARERGLKEIHTRMQALAASHGAALRPSETLLDA